MVSLGALLACTRASIRADPPTEAPTEAPGEAPRTIPPAEPHVPAAPDDLGDGTVPLTAPRRHGKSIAVDPPSPPRDDHDVWGGTEPSALGGPGLGCPPSPLPSQVRHGRRASVRLRSFTAAGALAPDLAERILDARARSLHRCALAAMTGRTELAGSLQLRLDVRADGRPELTLIADPELPELTACVRSVARAWRFPPADGASQLSAIYDLGTEAIADAPPGRPGCRR